MLKRQQERGKKGIWSIADTLADDEEEEGDEGENGEEGNEEDEDEGEEEEEEEENGTMNVKRRSREDGEEYEGAQKESSHHRLNQSAECAATAADGHRLLQNGHNLPPPPPPHLLDGLFPPGGPFNGGGIPPQLALAMGLPPDPNFLFALAAHSQMPPQNGIPPPTSNGPRLLPINPFMLLAQHFALNAAAAASANQPPMKSNCDPMPATGPMENGSFPIPPSSILPSLPPNLANNNPLRSLASPTTTLAIGQKRPKPMAQLDGLTMAKRQCQTQN